MRFIRDGEKGGKGVWRLEKRESIIITIAKNIHCYHQSSGAVSKSRWPSRAPVPNKPTVSVDVKQHLKPPSE